MNTLDLPIIFTDITINLTADGLVGTFCQKKVIKKLYIYIRNNPSLSIDIKGLRWVPLGNEKNITKQPI